MNERSGIGMRPIEPKEDTGFIDKIIDKAVNAENQEQLNAALTEPVKTYPRRAVDDTIKANGKVQEEAGLEARVTRIYDGVGLHNGKDICLFCKAREGKDVPYKEALYERDMFARHDGCGCIIEYTSKKGDRSRASDKNGFERIDDPRQKEEELEKNTTAGNRPKGKMDGSGRRKAFGNNWEERSMEDAIELFAQNATAQPLTNGKIRFSNGGRYAILYDTKGDYFRIEDTESVDPRTNKPNKRRYTDYEGNDVSMKWYKGKLVPEDDEVYERKTHFRRKEDE